MNLARRTFLTTLAGSALAGHGAFGAEVKRKPVVLWVEVTAPNRERVISLLRATFAKKFTEDVRPEVRMVLFDHSHDLLRPESRARILAHKPDILIGANSGMALRLRECEFGLPILFYTVDDPLAAKMVDSLVTPRMGMTGYSLGVSTERKRQEYLLRLAPGIRVMGKLLNEPAEEEGLVAHAPGHRADVPIHPFHVVTPADLTKVLESPAARKMDAWDVPFTSITFQYAAQSVPMLARLRKPVIHARMQLLSLGAMAAYEPDGSDWKDVLAEQARLILGGVSIEHIPVVQSTRFRFGLNLSACRTAGVSPPKSLVKLADEVLA